MYLKCLIIYSLLILNCYARQLIHSTGPPSKSDYNLENQNSIRSTSDIRNTVGHLRRSQSDCGSIKTALYEPINSFSENIDFNEPQIPVTQNRRPKSRQRRCTHYNNAKRKTAIHKHGQNLAAVSGTVHKLAKKFNKKHNSTKVTTTSENPLLLSPEDSKDNVAITDNSYTPDDNHSDANTHVNTKNSKHLIKSVQKSAISNKASTVHQHNIETKTNYMRNPYILVAIVALSVIILAAVIAGIVVHSRMKSCR